MNKQYNILTGDSLKEQFPDNITGEIIVARECLVDGDVKADTLDELFSLRAKFISKAYSSYSTDNYYSDSVAEFEKIKSIAKYSLVNLWFEDDLFCQVNLWFVAYLLSKFTSNCSIYLLRPPTHTPYGFGGLNHHELEQVYKNRMPIKNINKMAALWEHYQQNNLNKLKLAASALKSDFPFIEPAVEAHMARIPTKENKGKPTESLIKIMQELNTKDFGTVFKEFCIRESIYGYGDLQVKRLYDEIIKQD